LLAKVITLDTVSKTYGAKEVLAHATLHVPKARCMALVGPSGCGKSTLLRLVLGLVCPDAGTVALGGVLVRPETVQALRLRTGYVLQDGGLFPHLTARQNVVLVAERLGWEEPRISARVHELFDLLGLSPDLGSRYPAELSGGQRQRVGIMRALMLDPDVLLMDEPLGALDPILRARLQRDLKALFLRLKKTVLLVTHDVSEAAFLGDTVAIMREGRIVQEGTFEELSTHPTDAFVTEFIEAQRPRWMVRGAGA
jgi:osmoprotectant transport system ATP-binding protein